MADEGDTVTEKDRIKTFLIDINVKYQFTGTENDIEGLKNDQEYLKNVCNALLLNKNTGSDRSEVTPEASLTCTFTESRPETDIVKQSMQATLPSIPSISVTKSQVEQQSAQTNKKCLNVSRSRPRPIAIKPLPPTIYGNGSQQFVPIILKPVNNPFTFVPQTQIVSTVDTLTVKKPTPCSQPISPQASKFIAHQKSFLSDQHTFRPVKPNELLLDLYESHLDMFAESKYSRSSLWEKVATKMVQQGYTVSGSQCNNRWRYLLATFNKVATNEGESNSFKYFNRVAEILHKKSTMPVVTRTQQVLGEAMLEVLGDEDDGRPIVKKRRKRKEDEKDELVATLSKKMEQLQEMQNEMTTFLSAFKDGVVKKQ